MQWWLVSNWRVNNRAPPTSQSARQCCLAAVCAVLALCSKEWGRQVWTVSWQALTVPFPMCACTQTTSFRTRVGGSMGASTSTLQGWWLQRGSHHDDAAQWAGGMLCLNLGKQGLA